MRALQGGVAGRLGFTVIQKMLFQLRMDLVELAQQQFVLLCFVSRGGFGFFAGRAGLGDVLFCGGQLGPHFALDSLPSDQLVAEAVEFRGE